MLLLKFCWHRDEKLELFPKSECWAMLLPLLTPVLLTVTAFGYLCLCEHGSIDGGILFILLAPENC